MEGILLSKVSEYMKNPNIELVNSAYEFAKEHHKGMKRKSGEDYIIHPYNVALILTELNADENTIAAGLLHDVVEDCDCTINEIENKFGKEVAYLVDGVTKLAKINIRNKGEYDSANLRKMLFSAANDIRIILIKLADRLHNMRTLNYLSEEKQKEIARETLDIYAPLAYRLGYGNLKVELEDLGFKYSMPNEYNEILRHLKETKDEREKRLEFVKNKIKDKLEKIKVGAEVLGRVKHMYSIYRKIVDRDYDLKKMYDLVALRILTENIDDSYIVLKEIQKFWRTIPGTFKDYISTPKPNNYQSIHLSIIAEDGKPVEFQIRTKEMHEFAEEGKAVHWGYKGVQHGAGFDKKIQWLKQMIEMQNETKDGNEFLENLKVDLFSDSIFVFTPNNDIIELPKDSCPIDFAYTIHSGLGDKCVGAYVNGKFVSLKTKLQNGDIIEIITSNSQKPSIEWLKYVKTSKGRIYIRRTIKKMGRIAPRGNIKVIDDKKEVHEYFLHVEGIKDYKLVFSLCCNPLPGDSIKAFLLHFGRIKIHKANCKLAEKIRGNKEVNVFWIENIDAAVELNIEGEDRVGLMAELLNAIARTGINVLNAKGKIIGGGLGLCSISFRVTSLDILCDVIERLHRINGVRRIYIGKVSHKK